MYNNIFFKLQLAGIWKKSNKFSHVLVRLCLFGLTVIIKLIILMSDQYFSPTWFVMGNCVNLCRVLAVSRGKNSSQWQNSCFISLSLFCLSLSQADKWANQHLHDPDCSPRQPPEWKRYTHAADQSLHTSWGELHRKVPTMHHSRLHDVSHYQVIWTNLWLALNNYVVL